MRGARRPLGMTAPYVVGPRPVQVSPLRKAGFAALLLYIFVLHSRVLDLSFYYLHIPVLSLYACAVAAFLGGGVMRAFTHRIGLALLGFTFWMMLATPFSYWKGGSAWVVRDWLKTCLVFFAIAGLITTWQQFHKAIYVLAFSVLILALLAIFFGNMANGRLVLARGRFTNPNDLAQIFLMALPFWWFIAKNQAAGKRRRKLAYLAMLPILFAMSKTGSRGALIGFVVLVFVLFLRSPLAHKIQLFVGIMIFVAVAAMILPESMKRRYVTFFETETDPFSERLPFALELTAVGSTESRTQLLKDSVVLTWRHPFFGVGPGQFEVAQDLYAREVRNHKGMWQVTHNTFTEVSSELGLPALVFFVAAIWFCVSATRLPLPAGATPPEEAAEVRSASLAMRLSLLAYIVSAMFGSFAYQTQLLTLAGLSVAFSRTAAQALVQDSVGQIVPPRRARGYPRARSAGLAATRLRA